MCYYTIRPEGGKWAVGLLVRYGMFYVHCTFDSRADAETAMDKLNNFVAA